MPPTTPAPDAQQAPHVKHLLLYIGIGVVVGAVVLAAVAYGALQSGLLQSSLRGYFAQKALSDLPAVPQGGLQSNGLPQPTTTATSSKILVPKTFASQEYYFAINAVVVDFNAIVVALPDLQGRLVAINTQTSSGDFDGILDKLVAAKLLIAQESEFTARFARDLASLSAANQTTPDVVTRAQTLTMVSSGNALHADLQAYFTLLSALLSGTPPSGAQVAGTAAKTAQVTASLKSFKDSIQPLLEHFAEEVQKQTAAQAGR